MNSILTIFFLIIRIVSNPIANVFQKKLSTSLSSFTINLYTYLFLSIFSICLFYNHINFTNFNTEFYFLVFLAGFLCALGTICLIKAVNIGELSVIGPINSYKSLVGLFFAIFLLNELPSLLALFGIILVIWGSKYIFETTEEGFSFDIFKRKDVQLRLLALLLTGFEAVILKKIILLSSVEVCFIFWCITGLLWSIIFVLVLKKNLFVKNRTKIYQLLFTAICLGLMQYSTNYVFSNMNVGYALSLFQLSSIVTVFLGYKVFKEKHLIKKLIGSLIMILGSIIIILN